jgi:hypothetical protein
MNDFPLAKVGAMNSRRGMAIGNGLLAVGPENVKVDR